MSHAPPVAYNTQTPRTQSLSPASHHKPPQRLLKTRDIGCNRRLEHLGEVIAKARQVNSRLLMIERAGQGCAIGSALFERIHQPYAREGQRTGAFRFGDIRAMARAGALCISVYAVAGFTSKSLRSLVAGLLGTDYTTLKMTYDLLNCPPPPHGLIERQPHSHTYTHSPEGIRVAVFYTKLDARLLRPLVEADARNPGEKVRSRPQDLPVPGFSPESRRLCLELHHDHRPRVGPHETPRW